LKDEMYRNFDEHNKKLMSEESQRKDDIAKATARKDDIQR
jgi:hypothetical protein